MKNAVGYLRCSTDQQEDSTRQQKEEILRFAEPHGYNVIRFYEDFGRSGTSFRKRPEFMRMVKCAIDGHADFEFIIAYDESRWGRADDPEENSYWENRFKFEFGIEVVLVHTLATTESPMANAFLKTLQRSEASEYSKKLSRATLRGSVDNAKKGYSCGGSAPYGLIRIAVDKVTGSVTRTLYDGQHASPDTEKSKWDVGDLSEVEVVRRMFAEKIAGKGYVAIADGLNQDCIPPPKRGRWRNKDQKWGGVTIRGILANPAYYGARIYNRHPQSHLSGPTKDLWINPTDNWVVVEDAHPAIVSKETFDLANRRSREYVRNRHTSESVYLLTSLIKCGHCHFNFQGQNYGKKKVRYYVCGGYINKGNSVCSDFKINKNEIEGFVVREIRKRILGSDLLGRLEEEMKNRLQVASLDRLDTVESFERQLTDVNIRIQRLLTLAENSVGLEGDIVEKLKVLGKEKKQIEKRLSELQMAKLSPQTVVDARAQVQFLMDHFDETLKTAPIHAQKELLRRFIQRIDVDRETNTINVYLRKVPSLNSAYAGSTETVVAAKKLKEKKSNKAKAVEQCVTEPTHSETEVVVQTEHT